MNTHTFQQPDNLIDLGMIKKKRINLAIFGHGNVGSILIDQIVSSRVEISRRRDLEVNIFAVANSTSILLNLEGIDAHWLKNKEAFGKKYNIQDVINFVLNYNLDNLIAVDNTANENFVANYPLLIENGFNLISSNKIGNTLGLDFYHDLRDKLNLHKREYLYETNVGAGLPLIDTIKLLHVSGENITRIKGVFSGSLSYIFNTFSEKETSFSSVLKEAIQKGFTEPDPREDLGGNDVGRKLLVLARELDLHIEFDEISIQNLIPKPLQTLTSETFLERIQELDESFQMKKENQLRDHVLRYVGDLHGDLSKTDGAILDVKLVSIPRDTMIGQLKGSDSIFEIYTESYGDKPIVIQGAGAGAAVTARGVFGDVLRLSDRVN